MKNWIICFLLFFACSCATIKESAVEYVSNTDTVYVEKLQRDSVFLKDSVYVKEKNDTVLITNYKYKFEYKYIMDSIYINSTDTIYKDIVTVKEVEKKLSGFQWFSILGFWFIIVLGIYKLYKKFRK